jgi:hypothetical protein
MDPVGFWMEVSRAVALARNGHTTVNAGIPPLPGLPFKAWWFRDGLFIVQTESAQASLLGARIDRIGSVRTEEALRSVAPFISGNDRRIRALSPRYLRIPSLLHRLGLIDSPTEVPLALRWATGEEREERLSRRTGTEPVEERAENWEVLIPDALENPGRWKHVLDPLRERPRIYRAPVDVESVWLTGDHQTLYLRSNRIEGGEDQELSLAWKLLGIVATEVVPNRPRSVFVDLRLNSGGNFGNSLLFAQALPKVMPAGGRVYVLVSASTFSAALVTAALLKDAGGSRVTLIGTAMADEDRFWAEGLPIPLPNSGLRVHPAGELQDWSRPGEEVGRFFWANLVWGPKRPIRLDPEIEIDPTFEEYSQGHDPVLEKALELSR